MTFLIALLALPLYGAAALIGILFAYLADGFSKGYKSAATWLSRQQ